MEDPENLCERQCGLGAADRAQEAGFGGSLGKALTGEAEPGDPHQSEKEANDCAEDLRSSLELCDRGDELRAILFERVRE